MQEEMVGDNWLRMEGTATTPQRKLGDNRRWVEWGY